MCHLGAFAGLIVHGAAVLITSGEDDEDEDEMGRLDGLTWMHGQVWRVDHTAAVPGRSCWFSGSPVVPLVPVKLLKHFLSCRLFSLSVSLSDWRK